MSHLQNHGGEPLSRSERTHDARSEFELQLILSGICYLPAADVTCARISHMMQKPNARHQPVEENIASVLPVASAALMSHRMKFTLQGVQTFHQAKFRPHVLVMSSLI